MTEKVEKSSGGEINPWGVIIAIILILGASFFINLSSVRDWVERVGVWGPIVFILLKVSTIVIAPLSGSPLYPLVGIFFGFWEGLLYVALGDLIGCSINFYLARKFGQSLIFKFTSRSEEGVINRAIRHMGNVKGFLQASVALFAMPELVSYAAGLTRLPYSKFILVLGTINTLGAAVLVFIGTTISPTQSSGFIQYALPLLGVLAFAIGGILFSRGIRKKELEQNF